ncbi:MAG: class I SAM-dependent methyltransferase [Gammaproteobacteria bacterium]|nr:class I SAM-dependent methyltransferase [Gammaproteobacteria bacterium]
MKDDPFAVNWRNWESRVPIHARSKAYGLDRFLADPQHLSTVVQFDAPHLGDLTGLRVVHLQCHIGSDTLSLARLGASVTGVDFSPSALTVARDLSARAGPDVRYIEASVAEVLDVLPETFDLVYTGVGALNWLPSVAEWALTVASLLAPGGRLYLREGHPMLSTLADDRDDQELVVTFPYFETEAPQSWQSSASYTGDPDPLAAPETLEWSHGLAETVQAVLDAGLVLTRLAEHQTLDWRFFPWMEEVHPGSDRWVLPAGRERLPLMYTLEARKA